MYTVTLKAARVNAGLTQRDVAKQMSTNVATIVNWESGKTFPDVAQFRRLCEIYKCPIDIIFLKKKFTLSE